MRKLAAKQHQSWSLPSFRQIRLQQGNIRFRPWKDEFTAIIKALMKCDLFLSGGGGLWDATGAVFPLLLPGAGVFEAPGQTGGALCPASALLKKVLTSFSAFHL